MWNMVEEKEKGLIPMIFLEFVAVIANFLVARYEPDFEHLLVSLATFVILSHMLLFSFAALPRSLDI